MIFVCHSLRTHTFPQGPLAAAEENNIKQHTHRVVISKCTHLDLLLENVDLVLLLQELLLLSGNLQGRTCVRHGISLLVDIGHIPHSSLNTETLNTTLTKWGALINLALNIEMTEFFGVPTN